MILSDSCLGFRHLRVRRASAESPGTLCSLSRLFSGNFGHLPNLSPPPRLLGDELRACPTQGWARPRLIFRVNSTKQKFRPENDKWRGGAEPHTRWGSQPPLPLPSPSQQAPGRDVDALLQPPPHRVVQVPRVVGGPRQTTLGVWGTGECLPCSQTESGTSTTRWRTHEWFASPPFRGKDKHCTIP